MIAKNCAIALTAVSLWWTAYGCAPQPAYRVPPSTAPVSKAPPASPVQDAPKQILPQDSKIREQDIRSNSAPARAAKTSKEPSRQASVNETRTGTEPAPALPPPLADDSSLLAKITPGTPPQPGGKS